MNRVLLPLVLLGAMFCAPLATLAVSIDFVTVGDPGNSDDNATGFGGVSKAYRIGTYEVTNAQYAQFLNAKAKSDPLRLFNQGMEFDIRGGITRLGDADNYSYAVKELMDNKPVNYVSVFDAMRFVNWLSNGQGAGDTETGTYKLTGGTPIPDNATTITRAIGSQWFVPTEDEWYKAAYYQPANKGGDPDSYWLYPTASNSAPTKATANSVGDISNPGANVANYDFNAAWNDVTANVTSVGSAGPLSKSYYGTYDQAGNLFEWTQGLLMGTGRDIRGGFFGSDIIFLQATREGHVPASYEDVHIGFRVAAIIPEPSTFVLALAGIALAGFEAIARPRRRQRA